MRDKLDRSKILKAIIAVTISIILLYEFQGEIKSFNFPHTLKILKNLDNVTVILIFLGGLGAITFLTLYDFVGNKYFHFEIPFFKVFKIGWISGSINNFIGLGGLVGAGLRTFLYEKEGVDTKNAVRINIYIILSSITGLSVLILLGFLKFYDFSLLLSKNKLYLAVLLGFILYLPLYFFIDRIPILKKKFFEDTELVSNRFKIMMIGASILDWAMATLFFCETIMIFSKGLTFRKIIPVYLVSITLGIISFLPSGLGSFDVSAFIGLKLIGATSENALAGILVYRLFYYVVPWVLSMILFLSKLIKEKTKTKTKTKKENQITKLTIEFNTKALAVLVFFAGIILILSAAIPALVERYKIISNILSVPVLRFSKITSMAIGIMLIILSKGIFDKVKSAYNLTAALLILGSILTFIKGLDFEEALLLIIIYLLLFSSKDNFYREAAPIKLKNIILLLIITAIMSILYATISYSILGHFKHIKIRSKKEVFAEAGMVFFMIWAFVGVFLFSKVRKTKFKYPDNEDIKELEEFLDKNNGNIMTHLLFLRDKYFYYTKDKRMLIPFATIGDKLVVLGEPIGERDFLKEAIYEFREFADKYAMIPVFYEISDENFSIYHDYGYDFFKLGEEAIINLNEFNLSGKKKKDLRLAKNKVESGELQFEIVNPPFEETFFEEIKEISDEWLGNRKERGYSMGWFDRDYLSRTPIAIMKREGKIIAFANLMPLYDNESISIDLMRYRNDIPSGTMDALFIELMEWAKSEGYSRFNFGMAPLSNVGVVPYSRNVEKLVRDLYQYGNKIYSFNGLRKYKEKFQPKWESRYLAYPKGSAVTIVLLQIAILSGRTKNTNYH
ncbi:MAG: Phosphatidylglycerol lysyltransferase [Sporanaerobacter sp.]|uniref:bifunctional lysylphosphatidylglycerol flippase/synthetase MprF n=1 Tax=Sporanaerobacter sp. TaxID=2010183 RepID=UPI003A0FF569